MAGDDHMNEYKFRAWYTPGNIMVYPEWSEEAGSYFFDIPSNGTVKSVILGKVLKRRNFKPMLYVELKDRKGRDMYECDIVRRWIDGQEIEPAIITHTPKFWWSNIKTTAYEIIGNSFETPELKPKRRS